MIKILMIGGLLYLLYTMVVKKNRIPGAKADKKINNREDNDEGEYVDYEEVD